MSSIDNICVHTCAFDILNFKKRSSFCVSVSLLFFFVGGAYNYDNFFDEQIVLSILLAVLDEKQK